MLTAAASGERQSGDGVSFSGCFCQETMGLEESWYAISNWQWT